MNTLVSINIETFINKGIKNRNMKKKELVYRAMLYQVLEKDNRKMTQLGLAKTLGISLSTVNNALSPVKNMGGVKINIRNFEILNPQKILYYWASIRNLEKDIVYKTRVSKNVSEIEKSMPPGILFAGYSAYKFKFNDVPADYSEIYVYVDDLEEIRKRFPESKNPPNLFVLKKQFDEMTVANIFVDLWNMKEWYAKDFLKELEARLKM